ncbi:hypothetical protein SNL152K_5435 [Streptomyces sp. NL15-2K]|nr:hypothetical protein SNL152K_5435 [Streptomyces sp. NL15-2K]
MLGRVRGQHGAVRSLHGWPLGAQPPGTRCAHVPQPSPRPACGSMVPPQVAAM